MDLKALKVNVVRKGTWAKVAQPVFQDLSAMLESVAPVATKVSKESSDQGENRDR